MSDKKSESQRQAFRRWYEKHGEEWNAERQKSYAEDRDFREAAKLRAREYRELRKAGKTSASPMKRIHNGVEVTVYGAGYVADELGVSRQTLANWEAKGWLPKPTIKGAKRVYTNKQLRLIKFLKKAIDSRKAMETAKRKVATEWSH